MPMHIGNMCINWDNYSGWDAKKGEYSSNQYIWSLVVVVLLFELLSGLLRMQVLVRLPGWLIDRENRPRRRAHTKS